MSIDMYPDAAIEYIIHHADPVSEPGGAMKVFVFVMPGLLFEVYGIESDIAGVATTYPDAIYFWSDQEGSDMAPELTMEQAMSFLKLTMPANEEVQLSDEGVFVTDVARPFSGVETDDRLSPAPSMEWQ